MKKLLTFVFLVLSGFAEDHPTLKYEELGRLNLPDGFPSVYYRLVPEGFAPEEKYTLYLERLSGKREILGKYRVKDDGSFVTEKGEVLRENVQMLAYYYPGEPFTYLLEGSEEVFTVRIVPHPLIAAAKDSAKISVSLIDSKGSHFVCMGEGFEPNERIRVRTVSGKTVIEDVQIATEKGNLVFTLEPSVKKKKTGKCLLEVYRKDETLSLKFDWGREALQKVTANIDDIPSDKDRKVALENILKTKF